MDFEVYCDENHPELFTSAKPSVEFLMIGSLWLEANLRDEIKKRIWSLREQHKIWGEIKWSKVSRSALPFYKALIDLFESYGSQVRFRCIAVNHNEFDENYHQNDNELGFYKFYYQVLHHWIYSYNTYRIYCDMKVNRDLSRLDTLKRCLNNKNINAQILNVQALPSRQVVLIQLSDLLLGMASSRMNGTLKVGSAKEELAVYLENKLGRPLAPTLQAEQKFNIFRIRLQGGW